MQCVPSRARSWDDLHEMVGGISVRHHLCHDRGWVAGFAWLQASKPIEAEPEPRSTQAAPFSFHCEDFSSQEMQFQEDSILAWYVTSSST